MPSHTLVLEIRDLGYINALVSILLKSKPEALCYPVFCYLYSAKNSDNMANIPQVTCIYKITSPSGKIYIGQAINARRRFLDYKSKLARSQPGLNNSIKKYGWDKHVFEIINHLPPDVTQEVLNAYECFYMDAYRSCGIKLLNVKEGGSNGRNSDESIKKANDKWKEWYRQNPDGCREAVEKSANERRGKPLSQEHRKKMSEAGKGRVVTDEHRRNLSLSLRGKPRNYTKEHKEKSRETILRFAGKNKSSVYQYSTCGLFIKEWDSITLASLAFNISRRGVAGCLSSKKGRKTFGGYIWRPTFEGVEIDPIPYNHTRSPKPKEVLQLSLSNNFIAEWPSQTAAGKNLGIPVINISMCTRGKAKSAGGFIWRYK